MGQPTADDIQDLIDGMNQGNSAAKERLYRIVYDELRRRAQSAMGNGERGHTLQATALVNEAYAKLAQSSSRTINNSDHLMALMSRAMRQVLVDHARAKQTEKRGGGAGCVTLDTSHMGVADRAIDILEIDAALSRLAELDELQASIAELKLFRDMELQQIAKVVGVSLEEAKKEWTMARAMLRSLLRGS